jgi:hypothetical protein
MTIQIDGTLATTLTNNGTSNNPVVAYDNAADDGTLSTAVGTEVEAASNAGTYTTYDPWIATPDTGTAVLRLVLPSAQTLNFIAIAAHNLGALGATVEAQFSTNSGSTWQDCGAGSVSPADDQAIAFYFTGVSADYWRIRVTNAGSTDVEIGVALFSTAITIEQRIYQGYSPPITPTMVMLQSNVSEGNHLLGAAVIRKGSTAEAELTHIDPATLRGAEWKGFQSHFNDGRGFFWAWRPTKYGDLFYGWRQGGEIRPTNSGPKEYMSFSMSMRLYDEP